MLKARLSSQCQTYALCTFANVLQTSVCFCLRNWSVEETEYLLERSTDSSLLRNAIKEKTVFLRWHYSSGFFQVYSLIDWSNLRFLWKPELLTVTAVRLWLYQSAIESFILKAGIFRHIHIAVYSIHKYRSEPLSLYFCSLWRSDWKMYICWTLVLNPCNGLFSSLGFSEVEVVKVE